MATITDVLKRLADDVPTNAALASFVAAKKGGPATKLYTRRGNEFMAKRQIAASKCPFLVLVEGDEKERTRTFGGTNIRQEVLLVAGIHDADTERCSDRIVEFRDLVLAAAEDVLGGEVRDAASNPEGLLLGYDTHPVLSDRDLNRPRAVRTFVFEVAFMQ